MTPFGKQVATALLLGGGGWLLVDQTLHAAPGHTEARILATIAAVLAVLASAAAALAAPEHAARRLWLWAAPFGALLFLPVGHRAFSSTAVVVATGAAMAVVATEWARSANPSALGTRGLRGFPGALRLSWRINAATAILFVAIAYLLHPLLLTGAAFGEQLEFILIALAVALGVLVLARSWGAGTLGLGFVLILFGGFHWFTAVALWLAVSIDALLRRLDGPKSDGQFAALGVAAAVLFGVGAWLSAAIVLVPLAVWGRSVRRGWLAALIVTASLCALLLPTRSWQEVLFGAFGWLLVATVPCMIRCAQLAQDDVRSGLWSDRWWRVLAGLALAFVGLRSFDGAALIAPSLLWFAPMSDKANLAAAASMRLERGWVLGWVCAVALGAQLPWLRPATLTEQLYVNWNLTQPLAQPLPITPGVALITILGVLVASLLAARASSRSGETSEVTSALIPLVLITCAVVSFFGVPFERTQTLHRWPPLVLSADRPVIDLDDLAQLRPQQEGVEHPASLTTLWIDSSLSNARDLTPGVAVAELVLQRPPNGIWIAELVNGRDTAEWRLEGNRPQTGAPHGFSHWWTDGEPTALGHRRRARLELTPFQPATPAENASLRLRLAASLPAGVEVRIDRIAIGR